MISFQAAKNQYCLLIVWLTGQQKVISKQSWMNPKGHVDVICHLSDAIGAKHNKRGFHDKNKEKVGGIGGN